MAQRQQVHTQGQSAVPAPPLSRTSNASQVDSDSIKQSNHDVTSSYPLDPLKSVDHLRVRAALEKMAPTTFLDQISQPRRPQWQAIVGDWVSTKIPRGVFEKWKVQHEKRDHLYYEYNYSTETMIVRCMRTPMTPMRASGLECFREQASMMKARLSKDARNSITIGGSCRMSPF
jgi:hypothetical protein